MLPKLGQNFPRKNAIDQRCEHFGVCFRLGSKWKFDWWKFKAAPSNSSCSFRTDVRLSHFLRLIIWLLCPWKFYRMFNWTNFHVQVWETEILDLARWYSQNFFRPIISACLSGEEWNFYSTRNLQYANCRGFEYVAFGWKPNALYWTRFSASKIDGPEYNRESSARTKACCDKVCMVHQVKLSIDQF